MHVQVKSRRGRIRTSESLGELEWALASSHPLASFVVAPRPACAQLGYICGECPRMVNRLGLWCMVAPRTLPSSNATTTFTEQRHGRARCVSSSRLAARPSSLSHIQHGFRQRDSIFPFTFTTLLVERSSHWAMLYVRGFSHRLLLTAAACCRATQFLSPLPSFLL
jgi:hypothetical protein